MGSIEPLELLLRLAVASVCGGVIGIERELRGKAAGLRTVMLVTVGAAVFAILAADLAQVPGKAGYDPGGDMGRVLQGIVSGIGVLGAGVFLHRDQTVQFATTGASVWFAGSVGAACGLGLYLLAGAATVIAIVVLAGLGAIGWGRHE